MKKEIIRNHDVKVGDLFYTSWGYEQTNVNFFQVIELVGKSSVRVREVRPEIIRSEPISDMAADFEYAVPKEGEILPPAEYYSFIEDNEKGDLHRVSTKWGFPMFKVGKKGYYQETVRKYNGERLYVSWYA